MAAADRLKDVLVQKTAMTGIDWLVDAVIAAGVFGFGLLQITVSANLLIPDDFTRRMLGVRAVAPTAFAVAAVALTCLPLVVRRKLPWPAFLLSAVAWALFETQMSAVSLPVVGPLVALFTVAFERPRGEALAAAALMLLAIVGCTAVEGSSMLSTLVVLQNSVLVAAVALGGYALHVRQEYMEAAEARAAEAELTREMEAHRRVEEERLRIAREVHDITAHSLSAVSIQAAAAERLVDVDAAAAKEAIAATRATAKRALDEMRAVIGVLREGGAENGGAGTPTSPTKGTGSLHEIEDYLVRAGVACTVESDGYDAAEVPVYVDVALYNIAREAATNIVRHAAAQTATMRLTRTRDAAGIVVTDDGAAAGAAGAAWADKTISGHGLQGMRERVGLLGGTFEAGPRAGGGFAVQATIPLRRVE